MIVKIINRTTSSFAKLANYIVSDHASQVRVHLSHGEDEESPSVESMQAAVTEIEITQEENVRTRANRNGHLIVSFPAGEVPAREQLALIEQELVEAAGYSEHQRLSAVHGNTAHLHLHIAVNRIHPETFRNISPSWTKRNLQARARELEGRLGLQPLEAAGNDPGTLSDILKEQKPEMDRLLASQAPGWGTLQAVLGEQGIAIRPRGRGMVFTTLDGQEEVKCSAISREYSRGNLEQILGDFVTLAPKSPAVRDAEIHSGQVSLVTWIQENVAEGIASVLAAESAGWKDLHAVLGEHGLVAKPRGRGMVFATLDGSTEVKCSAISRDFSRGNLEQVLGTFAALRNRATAGEKTYTRSTVAPGGNWNTYRKIRETNRANRKTGFEAYKSDRDRRLGDLQAVYRQERQALWARTDLTRKQKFLVQKLIGYFRLAREREIKAELRQQREAIFQSTATGSWMDYLVSETNRGNREACRALLKTKRKTREGKEDDFTGAYITGKLPTVAAVDAVMNEFEGRFAAQKSGDLVIRSEDGENRVILRKNRLFVERENPRAVDFARRVAVNLFQTAFRIHGFSGQGKGRAIEIER